MNYGLIVFIVITIAIILTIKFKGFSWLEKIIEAIK